MRVGVWREVAGIGVLVGVIVKRGVLVGVLVAVLVGVAVGWGVLVLVGVGGGVLEGVLVGVLVDVAVGRDVLVTVGCNWAAAMAGPVADACSDLVMTTSARVGMGAGIILTDGMGVEEFLASRSSIRLGTAS